MYRTTDEHFEAFKDEAEKWIEYFGLTEWEIFFEHIPCNGNRAECTANNEGHIAFLSLSSEWNTQNPPDEGMVHKCAFHEVCELLLMGAWYIAVSADLKRKQRKHLLDREHHRVIRRLENALYQQAKEGA